MAAAAHGSIGTIGFYDDGTGVALFAGGSFAAIEGTPASGIAKWDGNQWQALGAGVAGCMGASNCPGPTVSALAPLHEASGSKLIAGGNFTSAGNIAARGIAAWDGAAWTALGSGVSGFVSALTEFDDGSGPVIYAGGFFSQAGGINANNIARWDGISWSPLGLGVNGTVLTLAVFDDGTGPALYAGGNFTSAGGGAAFAVAKWDGTSWTSLHPGIMGSVVRSLAVFDDGTGSGLYVGGDITTAGGISVNGVAKWDGVSWSPLDMGLSNRFSTNSVVISLVVFDDGMGSALYAGGGFEKAGNSVSAFVAKWHRPQPPCP